MDLAVQVVPMDLSVQGILHLLGRAAESNKRAASGHVVDGKALRLQPGDSLIDVAPAKTEAIRILLRRDPLVVVWREWVLLFRQQPV